MSGELLELARLRREFDEAFAQPGRGVVTAREKLLLLAAGGQPLAVRLSEIAGVVALRRVVPVPSRRDDLLGVAGLRGTLLPVFSLARLLGGSAADRGGAADEPARRGWTLLCGAPEARVGLSFGALDGMGELMDGAVSPAPGPPGLWAGWILDPGGGRRGLVSIPAVLGRVLQAGNGGGGGT